MSDGIRFPPFRPHRLVRGGHLQTLVGHYIPGRLRNYSATARHITLDDGDRLVVHDDCPANWMTAQPIALLLHGLAGCHLSPYMIRVAAKLNDIGARTFRMDHRGCGAGTGLARLPYHAGRSDDALSVVHWIAKQHPDSPIFLIGFSLSGNIVLKAVGEHPSQVPASVQGAIAVNPPIDLSRCVRSLDRLACRPYDRHFVKLLHEQVGLRKRKFADAPMGDYSSRPPNLLTFDDQYTAVVSGFDSAEDYYARCSSKNRLDQIQVPTLILAARDDPMIPVSVFDDIPSSERLQLHIADSGGHLGYVGRAGVDPDRRWMDWRIVDWVQSQCDSVR